jgi:type II secretory pathway component PulM
LMFNGVVWVCARVYDQVFWIPGKNATAFNGATMKRLKYLATYVHGEKPEVRKLKQMLEGEEHV